MLENCHWRWTFCKQLELRVYSLCTLLLSVCWRRQILLKHENVTVIWNYATLISTDSSGHGDCWIMLSWWLSSSHWEWCSGITRFFTFFNGPCIGRTARSVSSLFWVSHVSETIILESCIKSKLANCGSLSDMTRSGLPCTVHIFFTIAIFSFLVWFSSFDYQSRERNNPQVIWRSYHYPFEH